MAESQLKQLREKFEDQQKQFQNYRQQCKNLENFLESESNKKQQEIRKLKEEAITKQKIFKSLKNENSTLVNQITHLKSQMIKLTDSQDKNSELQKNWVTLNESYKELEVKYQKLVEELKMARVQNEENHSEIKIKTQKIQQLSTLTNQYEKRVKELQERNEQDQKSLEQQRLIINELQERKIQFAELSTSHKERTIQRTTTAKKTKKKQEFLKIDCIQTDKLFKYEDKIQRYEKTIKELRQKLSAKKGGSPLKLNSPEKRKVDEQSNMFSSKVYIACYVVTKQYYISPIVQLNDQSKCIKLFKSSRNGCFQKCLGATKHKVDSISHESSLIVKEIIDRIMKSEVQCNHSILIYGVKKSNKKLIMGSILTKLFNFLKNKIQNGEGEDLEATYIKKTSEQENGSLKEQADNADDILDLLEKLTNLGTVQQKKSEKIDKLTSLRKPQKPRIYYFNLRVNDFSLEIATSSFTGIPYRQKQVISTFYSNVLYSKLSDVLQSTYSQKYIVLTLNPIVDLYQDCKNTLSVTQYKALSTPSREKDYMDIDKQILNETAKKKLQCFEKQIEQGQVKLKKVEQQCFYFKSKFDELESRLKTLLSTHHGQSSYLKKSPILLSYEKLLKFVHAVQSKNISPALENLYSTFRINPPDFQSDSFDSNDAL